MLARVLAIGLLACASTVSGQIPSEQASKKEIKEGAAGRKVTAEDLKAIRHGSKVEATKAEKTTAIDVCSRKCKVCFDGTKCDYECAEKTCK